MCGRSASPVHCPSDQVRSVQFHCPLYPIKMSQTLIWHLIRDNNSFMVKRERTSRSGAVQFSSEPGNLMNAHSFKYSGISNNRAVDISSALALRSKVCIINNLIIDYILHYLLLSWFIVFYRCTFIADIYLTFYVYYNK